MGFVSDTVICSPGPFPATGFQNWRNPLYMKGGFRPTYDRILLHKRVIIETINDELKDIARIRPFMAPLFPEFHRQSHWQYRRLLSVPEETDDQS